MGSFCIFCCLSFSFQCLNVLIVQNFTFEYSKIFLRQCERYYISEFFLSMPVTYIQEDYSFLYLAILLNVFISCRRFLVTSLRSFIYRNISSKNKDTLTSSFLICIPFISFTGLIVLAKTSSTLLNRSQENGQPCLIPDFSGNDLRFSSFRLMLVVDFLYIAFIIVEINPLYLQILQDFCHCGMLNFVTGLFRT